MMKFVKDSLIRGCTSLMRRPLYVVSMVVIPLFSAVFFVTLLGGGVVTKVPSAIVDLDRSDASRQMIRTIGHMQSVDIKAYYDTYAEAYDKIQRGEIVGFFMIPEGYSRESLAGKSPQLSYYVNYSYFVPATYLMKSYTVVSAYAGADIATEKLMKFGVRPDQVGAMLQPYVNDVHMLGNPWTNYSIYLSNSFAPCLLALLIMIITAYTITEELKHGTSIEWLRRAGGSVTVALIGKLLPQTVVFTVTGFAIQGILYGFSHLPLNCGVGYMLMAMLLLVLASQSLAVLIASALPNMRWAISVCSLISMLAFSFTGFSFPVEDMYAPIAIFSYLVPIRYYFLIYVDQALNGIEFAYSARYYAALLCFLPLGGLLLPRLKKFLKRPVYIP